MADRDGEPPGMDGEERLLDEAELAVVARHALHDEELIAAFAVNDLDSEDHASRARALIDRCATCRDLHRDLAAITAAIVTDARGSMTAPRDFRLSVEDARRLGGTVSARGLLAGLRRSLDSFGRPLGASLATFGLVGVLIGTVAFGSGAASLPLSIEATGSGAPGGGIGDNSTAKSTDTGYVFGPASQTDETREVTGGQVDALRAATPNPAALLVTGSVAMLLVGLVLLFVTLRRNR